MPQRKRYTSTATPKRTISESSDRNEGNGDNSSESHKKAKPSARWDDLKNIGIDYEGAGYSNFNKVLDSYPLVCGSNGISPVVHGIIELFTFCLDFNLKHENGIIEREEETMTSEEVIEWLKSAKFKLDNEQFSTEQSNLASLSATFLGIKCISICAASKFINDIIAHVKHTHKKTQIPIEEGFFTMMISHFVSMCNLDPQFFSVFKHTMNVKGQFVSSIPDVRFTYTSLDETDGSVLTVSVEKSRKKTGDGEQKVVLTDSSLSIDEDSTKFHIHDFVGKDVLGQHGIDLLVESFYSTNQNKSRKSSHMFGMIVVGAEVIFTCLEITDSEVRNINSYGNIDAPRRKIQYSKPLNILSSSDRKHAIEILFRLSEKKLQ